MKFSIVTVCYNSVDTIADTLASVAAQHYRNVEHIVVDGGSTDGTVELLRSRRDDLAALIVEPDRGIYDAMNKGLHAARGDYVAFLNADDWYLGHDVLDRVARSIAAHGSLAVFGDVDFVAPSDTTRVVRRYSSRHFKPERIAHGWMPAHPALFLARSVYQRYGPYRTDYRIAADFEYVARVFWKTNLSYHYIPEVLVRMRTGGISTRGLASTLLLNREVMRACRENRIPTNAFKILSKYLTKVFEFRPKSR